MDDKAANILQLLGNKPHFQKHFEQLAAKSSQIILFGSQAASCQTANSDVDILFVKKGKGFKNEFFDFVTVDPKRIGLNSWLGSELANHIATYGIWIKGEDKWRNKVFISESSINRKKLLILSRLAQLWVKYESLKNKSMIKLFENVVLDTERLSNMINGLPVPPTAMLKSEIAAQGKNLMKEVCKPKYLGKVGETYINELFRENSISEVNSIIVKNFASTTNSSDKT
jgi:predicted nucleotidyltransferase